MFSKVLRFAFFVSLLFFANSLHSPETAYAHGSHDRNRPVDPSVLRHWQLDFGYPGFKELNQRLHRDFVTFDNRVNLALSGLAAQKLLAVDGHINGSWSPAFSLPLVPIHVMVLPNGKVLMWDSVGDNPAETYPNHDFTRASVWDPETNIVTNVNNLQTGYNVFCSGHVHLPDGTPFLAGGNRDSDLGGLNKIHLFNLQTSTWSLGPNLTQGNRWYPSATPLANGEILITSGGAPTPEVYTTSGTLRALSSISQTLPLYPWLQAIPRGNALMFGPSSPMRFYGTSGTGSNTSAGPRDGISRTYGSYAMYDIGKILAAGGGGSVSHSVVIDVRNPNINPVVTQTDSMNFGRRQHNLTALPDGTVLVTGGNSNGANLLDMNHNVFQAELWNPATGDWQVVSSASKIRQYHSTSLLLPDARVFTGGGGICDVCLENGYLEKNLEIYTPPYLYDPDGSGNLAPRPSITSAPGDVDFNETFFVETPDASEISQAVMMRVSSVTHSVDFEQRRVPLVFTETTGGLNIKAPPNANLAPPGYYMLFLINDAGVPSVAKMVRVQLGQDLGAPLIVAASGGNWSANLTWVPVPGATNYLIKYGNTPGNYTQTVSAGNVTTTTLNNLPFWRLYFVVAAEAPGSNGGDSNEVEIVVFVGPTAANISISGRVINSAGVGLPYVNVSIENGSGERRTAITNAFGFYRFDELEAGTDYLVGVSSKRYSFAVPTRLVRADDNIADVNFVSDD